MNALLSKEHNKSSPLPRVCKTCIGRRAIGFGLGQIGHSFPTLTLLTIFLDLNIKIRGRSVIPLSCQAMDFLKSAVVSAIAKGTNLFPCSLGDRVDIGDSFWTLHNATKRVRNVHSILVP
jgi:hypothetical protein